MIDEIKDWSFSIIFFFQHHDNMQQRGYFPQVEYFNDVECTATPVQPMVVSENKGKVR